MQVGSFTTGQLNKIWKLYLLVAIGMLMRNATI